MEKKEVYLKKIKFFERKHPVLAAFMIGLALIMVWRGIWLLADEYLFPGNTIVSALVSIAIGLIILYFRDFDLEELKV